MTLNRNLKDPIPYLILGALICLAIAVSSCSCDWHLGQVKKKCGSHSLTDTLHIRDTLFVKESRVDTIFKRSIDTVHLNNDRLHVKYFYNYHDSTIYIQGKCDSLVVYKDKIIEVQKNVFEFDYLSKYKWYIIIPLLIIMAAFILKALMK